jgi:hypothetical protein
MPPSDTPLFATPGLPASVSRKPQPQPKKRGRPPKGQQPTPRQPKNNGDDDGLETPRLVKKRRGTAPLRDIIVPSYSQEQLKFGSQKQAWEKSRDRLAALETVTWMPPANDTSIPQNDTDRKTVVRLLLGAMRDTSHCLDQGGSMNENRWGPNAKELYDIGDMEKVCWDILVSFFTFSFPAILANLW